MPSKTNKQSKPIHILGVIGDPVHHSLSPIMHNMALAQLKLPFIYKAFHVKPAHLKKFVRHLKSENITGLNVTIPHKETIIPFLDQLTPEAKKMGAVNTVYLKKGLWIGDNTDGQGYLLSLEKEARFKVKNKNIVMIGAGGAAKGIALALLSQKPKSLLIINRTLDKAKLLQKQLQCFNKQIPISAFDLSEINKMAWAQIHLIINTTSVGLKSNAALKIPWEQCQPKTLVSDIVYAPLLTRFLKDAQKFKLKIHPGWGMLLYQGALAFELFTGKKAPTEIMKQALLEQLI
ncbi:MAG: shikimate 5-dehydrogenase [uncultured bacterium]|nr:MAG: shikimate 5-dehydrogenase [uncultured bacterium]